MAIHPLQKKLIPRRTRKCAKSGHLFQPGDEYLTLITEGKEGEFLREDILYSYWKEHEDQEELQAAKSHWRGKIHESKIKDQSEMVEKTMDLFYEAYEKQDLLRTFMLSLFLARKKAILFRQELPHAGLLYHLYEVVGGEEVLTVQVVTPTEEEMKRVQHELESLLS